MKGPGAKQIEMMFDSIAVDYDRLNHLFSLGTDKLWRRVALKKVIDRTSSQNILDAACGTGDFSIAIARAAHRDTMITGADLSENMLSVMNVKVGRAGLQSRIKAIKANCEALPFDNDTFDVVTIAFGIRNFENREVALREFGRVLRPGGKLLVLELSVPQNRFLRRVYNIYFTRVMPWVGGFVSGQKAAYRYLPASVINFPGPAEWMATMSSCGYTCVEHKPFTLGLCRMYTGIK
ncbi:MAG: bifunctional demethylmenaquinone methyltransferase/2-methoxy-6-polyprenyl-1,4-benzoquinol methylase UbiE [Bacteroidales bacterium]|nr:bifunctional demethylmenaquinone methyltransferase/2-methoxy-6-polyprenyl-1,4-benzoquinol methylase UbiE [Bacteroidales bacterium]